MTNNLLHTTGTNYKKKYVDLLAEHRELLSHIEIIRANWSFPKGMSVTDVFQLWEGVDKILSKYPFERPLSERMNKFWDDKK